MSQINLSINAFQSLTRDLSYATSPAITAMESGDGYSEAPGQLLTLVDRVRLYGDAFCRTYHAPDLAKAMDAFRPLADALGTALTPAAKVQSAKRIREMVPALEVAAGKFTPMDPPVFDSSCARHTAPISPSHASRF